MKRTRHYNWVAAGRHRGRMLGVTAVLAAAAIFLGACSGDDGDDDAADTDPTATVAATGSTDAAATGSTGSGSTGAGATGSTGATGSNGSTGSTGSTGGGGSASLPGEIVSPTTLDSFRWEVTFRGTGAILAQSGIPADQAADGFTASGAYVAPDQAQLEVEIGGQSFGQVIKGDQQWLLVAGTVQGPLPATEQASSLVLLTEAVDLGPTVAQADLECDGPEEVNGVSAIRCESNDANQQLIDEFGVEGATVDEAMFVVWIAEEGNYMVRWQLEATGTQGGEPFEWDFEANITDVNNVDSIETP